MRKVRFILTINDVDYPVFPVWGDTLSVSIERAQDYRGLRRELDGDISFVREDYDLINAQTFEQKFWLRIEVNDGAGYYTDLRGYFYKTYLTQYKDATGLRFELTKLVIDDRYERVMNALSNEYNLPDINVATTTLNYVLQPVLQIYFPGSEIIANLNGGNSWETPVTVPTTNATTLITDYHFLRGKGIFFVPGTSQVAPGVAGQYDFNSTSGWYEKEVGSFSIRLTGSTWNIHEDSGGGIVFAGTPGETDEFASVYSNVTGDVRLYGSEAFYRVLCNAETLGGFPTDVLAADDFVVQNNYTRALGIQYDKIFGSDDNTTIPRGYGRFASDVIHFADNYFLFPDEAITTTYFPVMLSTWTAFSIWCYFDATLIGYQEEGAEERIVKDAYKFADVVSAVLAKIDPELSHEEDPLFSDFLYGDANPIRTEVSVPFFVPKTNITERDYDIPAKKAALTLRDLLDFARATWRCDWHIDSTGRFIFEHTSYYSAGKSYTTPNIVFDLDLLIDPKNRLPWQHGQRIFRYDLDNMPERIEKTYQEDASPVFDGLPIEVQSVYINPGTVERYQLSRFFSDIDFALSTEVAKDGFFYCEAIQSGLTFTVSFDTINYRDKDWYLQNGRACWPYLDNKYGRHELPAESVILNAETIAATSVRKSKRTGLTFAGVDAQGNDYMHLVTIDGENGEIAKASVQVATGNISIDEIELPI
jgi:hypothetical protein